MKNLKPYPLLILLLVAALPAWGQTLTGSLTGTVKDEQGGALPGVTVTLTSKTGTKAAVSGPDGTYRFLALDPGVYGLRAEMAGFRTTRLEDIILTVGKTLNADFAMKVAGVAETIEVLGESPVVDVGSSATSAELSQDLLFNMPIRQGNTATNLLNFAPGINNSSAYGGDASSGNGLLIDGVDTRDPSGGTAWTFYNYNIVEEVQFQGLGAPAEYGAFTGAIVNTITKSGGNRHAGLFDIIYTRGSLASSNRTQEIVTKNPALRDSAKTRRLTDFTTQFSGPLIKDKLFFFGSAQRYYINQDPSGPLTLRNEVSPRLNLKLTWQPNPNDNVMGHFQYDEYNIIGRPGVSALVATDDLTNEEDAPEYVWLGQWRHLFGSRTFSEVKYTGWWGYFDLTPKVTKPGRLDENGLNSVSQGWFYLADRGRHQVNASLTHYAEAFGKHDLKFGVEIERSKTRDRYGYNDGIFYYDYGGAPYLAYSYGYDISGRNQRESIYAQDAWRIGDRLTLNPGLRLDNIRGKHPDIGKVYDSTHLAPRVGFAFDLTGDQRTVFKGSYSQYYEGIFNDIYKRATPGISDYVTFDVSACPSITAPCPPSRRVEIDRTPSVLYKIDPEIEHPRVDEMSLAVERAIGRDIRVVVTGIRRENKNFIGSVAPSARWTPFNVTSASVAGLPSRTIGVYRWVNRTASNRDFLITNPDGFRFLDPSGNAIGTINAERTYRAFMAIVSKRFSHRWMGQLSYVVSKTEGTISNGSEASFGSTSFYETPVRALVNVDGEAINSRRHEVKLLLGVEVPVVEVRLNAYFRSLSGRNYEPFQRFSNSSATFNNTSSAGRQPFLEPRGTRRLPRENILDLRVEKIFSIGARRDRIALYADITNVTNESTITSVLTRVPSTTLTVGPPLTPGGPNQTAAVLFEAPGAVIAPRQVTLGVRWSF